MAVLRPEPVVLEVAGRRVVLVARELVAVAEQLGALAAPERAAEPAPCLAAEPGFIVVNESEPSWWAMILLRCAEEASGFISVWAADIVARAESVVI